MLSFTLSNVAFGSVDVGASSASQIVTVTNTGAAAISIVEIAVGGPNPASFVFANNCITSLAPGNTCTIHRHFAPTTTGPLTAYITVTSSPHSPQTITLTGTGVEPVVSLSVWLGDREYSQRLAIGYVDQHRNSAAVNHQHCCLRNKLIRV